MKRTQTAAKAVALAGIKVQAACTECTELLEKEQAADSTSASFGAAQMVRGAMASAGLPTDGVDIIGDGHRYFAQSS